MSKDYSDLKAIIINSTLKKSPEVSNTEGLFNISKNILQKQGIHVEIIRAVDYDIPPGVYPDMTSHGWTVDKWPGIQHKVMDADILILATPIWLGDKSSICTKVIERLYGSSSELNSSGQYAYYGKVGGCIITGNEDGAKHCAMNMLYSLQHLGFTIPPQADAAWLGPIGPGPSYLDKESHASENDFTNRNATFMTWNLIHMARMIKDNGGIPTHGNQRSEWDAGHHVGFENPEYR